ncbi:MAG TPA: MFS transporter [Thermomicrobiales bacterium]|nr:MFS transporter [Thermomicrobiales bacterium]
MSINPTQTSRFLLLVAFLAFVSIGLPDAVLGVAWPSIRETFGRPLSDLGFILFASGAGYFTSGVIAGKAIETLGVGRLLAVSTGAVALGLFGYAFTPAFWPLLIAAVLIGLGSGAIDAGLNVFAAEHFTITVMNLLHAFFGIGAMVGPFIMAGVLASGASWRVGYLIVATLILLMAITFAFTARQWDDGHHTPDKPKPLSATMSFVLRQPLVWLQVTMFFVMTGIEACAAAWAFTSLTERFGMGDGPAGIWAGLYWGALAFGRLVLPTLSRDMLPTRLMQVCTWGLLAGALLMTRDELAIYQGGLLLFGLAMAPMFPTMMSLTPARLGQSVSTHAIGFQVSAAVLGAAAVPSLAGVLSERTSLVAVAWTLVVGSLALIALDTFLRLRTTPPPAAAA